jgi:hypothetical protein
MLRPAKFERVAGIDHAFIETPFQIERVAGPREEDDGIDSPHHRRAGPDAIEARTGGCPLEYGATLRGRGRGNLERAFPKRKPRPRAQDDVRYPAVADDGLPRGRNLRIPDPEAVDRDLLLRGGTEPEDLVVLSPHAGHAALDLHAVHQAVARRHGAGDDVPSDLVDPDGADAISLEDRSR